MGISQNYGYLFGGPHNKDYSILGSILGSPYFGKLPNEARKIFVIWGSSVGTCLFGCTTLLRCFGKGVLEKTKDQSRRMLCGPGITLKAHEVS